MGCHKSDGWHVDVCVLTWLECPWSRHLDGDSARVSWKGLDHGFATSIAEVAVHDGDESPSTLGNPDSDGSVEESDLGKIGELEMVIDAYDD